MGRILFKGCAVDSELSVCVFSVSLPIFEKDRFKKCLFRLLLWHPQVVESWSTIRSWIIIKLESQVARDHENYHKQNCEMERTTSLAARVLIKFLFIHPRRGFGDSHFCKMTLAESWKQRVWPGRNPANSRIGKTTTCSISSWQAPRKKY